jgi:LEA14-like dessication related protein
MRACCYLGLSAVVALHAGCASIGMRPTIEDVRARITTLDLKAVSLALDVDVKNPYPVALKTPRFKYGFDVQETPLVESGSETSVDLPAGRVGTATLPLRVRYADLWALAASLRDSRELSYRLHGAFVVDALGQSFELPLSHEGAFPVLRLPKFSVQKLDVSELSLSRARVSLDVDVRNPNVFAIDGRDLGYVVRIGDVEVGGVSASTLEAVPAGGSGRVNVTGEITARSALLQLARGVPLGEVRLLPTGSLQTPYGPVELPAQP